MTRPNPPTGKYIPALCLTLSTEDITKLAFKVERNIVITFAEIIDVEKAQELIKQRQEKGVKKA